MDQNPNQQPDGISSPVPPTTPEPQPETQQKQHGRKKTVIFISAGVALVLLILASVYWFFLTDATDKTPTETTSSTQTQNQADTTPPTVATDSTPVTFKSDKLNIELTHRKDWTLKESSDGALVITSPRISYAASGGTSKTGVFTLRIRKGATEAMQATIDKSVATRDSEVIAYAAPAPEQRQYTNLSFAGPKDKFGFFIVTSNTEFKAGTPLMYSLQFSDDSYLIAGGYGVDTGNSLAFDSVPKDVMDSSTLEQAIDIVESLKIY